jgi:2'-hydroxyisoflavone reductase
MMEFVEQARQAFDVPSSIVQVDDYSFLGPHQIAYALKRGHSISTFTRGKTLPSVHQELFANVEQLIGDREDDLSALENGQWDVVIDNSGRKTEWTQKSAQLLKDKAKFYLYTSSTGVYYPYLKDNIDEESKVLLQEPTELKESEDELDYWYGVMKATSEQATIKAFGVERSIIVRPTYMMGPADKTDRFIYWPIRLPKGGEILVPGKTADPVEYIDVRDVAEWMIRLAEE